MPKGNTISVYANRSDYCHSSAMPACSGERLRCLFRPVLACTSDQPVPIAEVAMENPVDPEIDIDALKQDVVNNYASGAPALYSKSFSSAQEMDVAVDTILTGPGAGHH